MKSLFLFLGLACCLTVILYFTSCRRDNAGEVPANPVNSVLISNFSFATSNLQVQVGTTVTWTNNDNATHTVTADDGSFNSGDLAHGNTYSHTFTTAGAVHYHCKYHSMMIAIVTVQ